LLRQRTTPPRKKKAKGGLKELSTTAYGPDFSPFFGVKRKKKLRKSKTTRSDGTCKRLICYGNPWNRRMTGDCNLSAEKRRRQGSVYKRSLRKRQR